METDADLRELEIYSFGYMDGEQDTKEEILADLGAFLKDCDESWVGGLREAINIIRNK